MRTVHVDTALDLPHLGEDDRLRAVLQSALARTTDVSAVNSTGPFWPASFFGLDGVQCFRDASKDQQARVVAAASRATLEEAWFIEKAGMVYTAQMSLLATSTEERQLYSLFAADEAAHLHLVGAFLPPDEPSRPGPFHALLADVIETADRATLIFVIQVVLEGWGLVHYRQLAEGTHSAPLRAAFERILKDEARHHGSGLLLFDQAASGADVEQATALLERFLAMVLLGPLMVVGCLSAVLGPLDNAAKTEVLHQLNADEQVRDRLALLRGLMDRPTASAIVAALDARGAWS